MDRAMLAKADDIVASLSPAKRETVREIVINSVQRGEVVSSARRYLTAATGGPELADILSAALSSPQPSVAGNAPKSELDAPTGQALERPDGPAIG